MCQERLSTLSFDTEQLATRLRRLMPYFLGGLGIAFMVAGIVINYIQTKQSDTSGGKILSEVATGSAEQILKTIKVEASGAVERPGVYDIPYDSRVKDVLITAGGLVAKADRNYISKNINLAQRAVDGTKIYFPFMNESVLVSGGQSQTVTSVLNTSININSASSQELDTLPGIGPVTAGKIIAARPYQNISELVSRKVVSQSVFDKIKDKLSIN